MNPSRVAACSTLLLQGITTDHLELIRAEVVGWDLAGPSQSPAPDLPVPDLLVVLAAWLSFWVLLQKEYVMDMGYTCSHWLIL